MDVDEFFHKYGEFGPYQQQIFWIIVAVVPIQAFHNIHHVYLGAVPEFSCINAGKDPVAGCPDGGSAVTSCEKFVFPARDFTSVVSEWELVCDNAYLSSLIQSVYMVGFLVGNVMFGWMADHYGRRPVIYWTVALLAVFTIIGAFSQSYYIYAAARFAVGACSAGFGLAAFTYCTEIIGASKRSFIGAVMPAGFAIGICLLSLLAYLIRQWRVLSLATMLPCLVSVYWYLALPESPRWLLSQGRVAEAQSILQTFAQRNMGKPITEPIVLRDPTKGKGSGPTGGSMLDLIRYPILRGLTLNNLYTWFVNCVVYYGITMNSGNLGSNIYISTTLSGLIELPSFIVMVFMMDRLGRRYSFSWSMLVSGVFCLLLLMLPDDFVLTRTSFALMGKFGICISFCLAYVYVAEQYPTNIRNKAIGAINISARIGGVVAPLIITLGTTHRNADFLIFGALALSAGVVALRLPETLNRPMAETIGDLMKASESHDSGRRENKLSEDKVKLLQGEISAKEDSYDNEAVEM